MGFKIEVDFIEEENPQLTERSLVDTYDEFVAGFSLCDVGFSHQISLLKSFQIGVKNIFGFTNPEYISNISGRLYYINIKINIKK